jgi:ABC-type branched-subunit amino acid transport system substrate-binding protein
MRKSLSAFAALAVCSGVFVALSGTTTAGASSFPPIPPGPIVIGATTPLSGTTAAFGQTTQESFNGITMKAFNAEHPNGILGHPVQLNFLDDQGTVTGGVQTAEQLVADHVAAVVTLSYNPEATAQQAIIFQKNKIPVFSVLSGNEYTNTKQFPYDFATGPSIPQEAIATSKWVKAEGLKRVALLDDGLQQTNDVANDFKADLAKYAPGASIVTTQTIVPASVEVSSQIAAIKAANPDVVYVDAGEGYGPIWQAMITAGLTNVKILASAGAWYDSFSAMGPLEANAYAPYDDCATSASETWPADVTTLMQGYSNVTFNFSTNYLTYVATDTIPLDFLYYAITKEHSDSPQAIKAAMEGIHNKSFETVEYNFSPTNHYGITGEDAAAVCQMGPPYAGGFAKVPVVSQG